MLTNFEIKKFLVWFWVIIMQHDVMVVINQMQKDSIDEKGNFGGEGWRERALPKM